MWQQKELTNEARISDAKQTANLPAASFGSQHLQTAPVLPPLRQAPEEASQQRARRLRQCALANHAASPCPLRAAHRLTNPTRLARPSRRCAAGTHKHASHLSQAAKTAWSRRSAPERVGQFSHKSGTHPALLRKAFPGRQDPFASRAYHALTRRKRPESQRNCRHAARASAHTPTAHWSVHPPRLTPPHDARIPEQPHRAAGTPRHAPYLSRAARTTRNRSGEVPASAKALGQGGYRGGTEGVQKDHKTREGPPDTREGPARDESKTRDDVAASEW